jgi:hypothetical protein
MQDFNIAKFLKENKLGCHGIFNNYIDLQPLKEEEIQSKEDEYWKTDPASKKFRYDNMNDVLQNMSKDLLSLTKNYTANAPDVDSEKGNNILNGLNTAKEGLNTVILNLADYLGKQDNNS